MEKVKNPRLMMLAACVYSILFGIGIVNVIPEYHMFALAFNSFGIGGLLYYGCTWSKFNKIFQNSKLGIGEAYYPIQLSKVKSKSSTTYKFTLPTGLSVEDIIKKQGAIEEHLGKQIKIDYINKGMFTIEVFHDSRQQFFNYEPQGLKGNIPILIGKDRKGNIINFDLAEGTEPHLLIAGSSGCGKSTILRSIITNLILTSNANLHLIDLKHGAEFSVFRKSSHVKSFCDTLETAEKTLKSLVDEIDIRYQKLAKCGFNDIQSYNKKFKRSPMPYELLIIDEMIDFQVRKDLFYTLEVISAKARACGIHVIFSTQRPDKDVLNGRIKNNVTNVLGLKTRDGINSRIIIDEEGLEKLYGKGHGILLRLGEKTEIQTPYLDVGTARELIKGTYINKFKEAEPKSEELTVDLTELDVWNI